MIRKPGNAVRQVFTGKLPLSEGESEYERTKQHAT